MGAGCARPFKNAKPVEKLGSHGEDKKAHDGEYVPMRTCGEEVGQESTGDPGAWEDIDNGSTHEMLLAAVAAHVKAQERDNLFIPRPSGVEGSHPHRATGSSSAGVELSTPSDSREADLGDEMPMCSQLSMRDHELRTRCCCYMLTPGSVRTIFLLVTIFLTLLLAFCEVYLQKMEVEAHHRHHRHAAPARQAAEFRRVGGTQRQRSPLLGWLLPLALLAAGGLALGICTALRSRRRVKEAQAYTRLGA